MQGETISRSVTEIRSISERDTPVSKQKEYRTKVIKRAVENNEDSKARDFLDTDIIATRAMSLIVNDDEYSAGEEYENASRGEEFDGR